jgi:hypothetical protein
MGTNNFYKKNAKNYYIIEDDYNDYNDYYNDYDNHYDNFKEVLNDTLKQQFKDNYYKHKETISFSKPYSGSELGEIEVLNINHGNFLRYNGYYELLININPVIRSGYYEGANLDFNINFELYCEDKDGKDISFNNDDFIIDTTYEEKILILTKTIENNIKYNKRLIKKINKEFYNAIDKLEKIYSKLSTPMIKAGGFSDGTAIYEKSTIRQQATN